MNTIDYNVVSTQGWFMIPLNTNVSMDVFKNHGDKVLYKLGNTSISAGIELVTNTPITVDIDVYVKVVPGFNNFKKEALITAIKSPV